jgi:PEP-CTERM motif
MQTISLTKVAVAVTLAAAAGVASASLTTANSYTGPVGISVDGIGSNNSPTGQVQAKIPVGATILKAYLYSAGTPFPWYPDSPQTLADYNTAGITLNGTVIDNFSLLVGAVSTRVEIGQWYTGRADVTSLVKSLTAGAVTDSFSWTIDEGRRSNRFDGELLAIAYSLPGLPEASVAFLDGGQNTGGETTTVNFASPITDPSAASFAARLGLGISFSCCDQQSTIKVNGTTVTTTAGNFNDGLQGADGSLFTVGGLGDDPGNNVGYAVDDELYSLAPFLSTGDTSFQIFTQNPTNDDNIFFASLYVTAKIGDIDGTPPDNTPAIPEPETYAMMLAGLGLVALVARRRRTQR